MIRFWTSLMDLASNAFSILFDEINPMDHITMPLGSPFPGFDQYGMRRS